MSTWKPISEAPKGVGILVGKKGSNGDYYLDFVVQDKKGFCYDIQNKFYICYNPTHFRVIEKPDF